MKRVLSVKLIYLMNILEYFNLVEYLNGSFHVYFNILFKFMHSRQFLIICLVCTICIIEYFFIPKLFQNFSKLHYFYVPIFSFPFLIFNFISFYHFLKFSFDAFYFSHILMFSFNIFCYLITLLQSNLY